MFAKLKKKLQDETGVPLEGDKGASAVGPGLASPLVKNDNGDSSPLASAANLGKKIMDTARNISFTNVNVEESTKEEVLAMLVRRTEQCKKLEAKISEYSMVMKDKNKMIEQLESSLDKQQKAAASRVRELNEQAEKAHTHFMERLKAKSEEINELRGTVRGLEERLGSIREARGDAGDQQQQEKLGALTSRLAEMEASCDRHAAERLTWQQQVTDITADRDRHKADSVARCEEIFQLTQEKSLDTDRVECLTRDLAAANKTIHEQKESLSQYEERISALGERLDGPGVDDTQGVKAELNKKTADCEKLSSELQLSRLNTEQLSSRVHQLNVDLSEAKQQLTTLQQDKQALFDELQSTNHEKDELLLRNAELSQNLTSTQHELRGMHGEMEGKMSLLTSQQESISDLGRQIVDLDQQNQRAAGLASNMEALQTSHTQLEEQLNDKNKMIKTLQQRLADLKKALQRELRVQTLPTDDHDSDSSSILSSFPPSGLIIPHSQPLAAVSPLMHTTSPSPPVVTPTSYDKAVVKPYKPSLAGKNSPGDIPAKSSSKNQNYDLNEDINFQYLKHVVIKFILSQESEALKLVAAVSALLRLSKDERRLVRETLEWKMSWFGSRPDQGHKQSAKAVYPPA